jgi:hypothetical protein
MLCSTARIQAAALEWDASRAHDEIAEIRTHLNELNAALAFMERETEVEGAAR